MTELEQIRFVTNAMRELTKPFVTPIAYELDKTTVRLAGTGNFLKILGHYFLVTCEHVVSGREELRFRPWGTEEYLAAPLEFTTAPYPYDVAVGHIDQSDWASVPHKARAVDDYHSTFAHRPAAQNELLFFKGYAGENSAFAFDTLATDATSYTTPAIHDADERIDDRFFFLLSHKPEDTQGIDEDHRTRFESPEGFSGSLVWDTGYVGCLKRGEPWSPEQARVTGIVCRWLTGDPGIKVLRIEYLRSFLLHAIEDLRAAGAW